MLSFFWQEKIINFEKYYTITFNTDIPYDVHITPTVSYTYSNPVLALSNVKNNITINRYYSITYNLNGGTNPSGQPTKFLHGTSETILDPTYQNHTFVGWYRNASFTGSPVTTTSGISENLVLYAKWSSGSYETAATYIASLVGNAPTNSTNIITVSAPTGETCTNTFAYDGTTDNNLRYVGLNPCNYIKFNCDSNDNCELWRIIGVMNGIDSNPVLKLVAPLSNDTRPWHTASNSNWEAASLNTYLNNDYLNALNNGVISNYVLNVQWNIGKVSYDSTTPNFYVGEKNTKSSNHYIGLIGPSDYGYATSATSDSTRNSCINAQLSGNSYTTDCINNNYLYHGNQLYQWTITANSNGNAAVRIANTGRSTRQNIGSRYSYNYMPTIYLKSSIRIKTNTGNGSSNSPYELESFN